MARSAAATEVNLNRPMDDYKTGPRQFKCDEHFSAPLHSSSLFLTYKRLKKRGGADGSIADEANPRNHRESAGSVPNLKSSLRNLCVPLRLCGELVCKAANRRDAEDAEVTRS